MMFLQAEEHQVLLETPKGKGKCTEEILLLTFKENMDLPTLDFGLLSLESFFVMLSHPVCGACYHSPKQQIHYASTLVQSTTASLHNYQEQTNWLFKAKTKAFSPHTYLTFVARVMF